MRIASIETKNFKALSGERTFSPGEGIIGIIGPNGSGKSTIANAIAWCLYGPEVLPTGKADVITWGQKECSVVLTFDLDGRRWSARRWQGRPPLGGARIDSEAGPVAEGLSATLRAVEVALGADRVAFLSSVFSRQEELSALASLTPANRMKTVLRLLGVEELNGAIEHTRGLVRDQARNLITLRSNLEDITQLTESLHTKKSGVDTLNHEMDAMQSELGVISRQSVELRDRITTLSSKIEEYNQYKLKKAQSVLLVDNTLSTLKGLLNISASIKILPSRAPVGEPDLAELNVLKGDASFYSRRIADINSEVKSTSTECPVCKRPYDNEEQLHQHKAELSREGKNLDALLGTVKSTIKSIEKEVTEYDRWSEYDQARNEQLSEYNRVKDAIFKAYDQYLEAQLNSNLVVSTGDVTPEIEQIQLDASEIDSRKNAISIELAVRKERLLSTASEVQRLETELSEQLELEELVHKSEHILKVHETASKELVVLKDKVIGSAIPALESRASSLVNEMTGGKFTDLSLSPDYDIRYRNNLGEQKESANLSGGERDVFALALRLALSELRADRIGILFLDEVLESLDDEYQELVWSTLERLTRRYNQIFVITHVERFRDRMPYLLA